MHAVYSPQRVGVVKKVCGGGGGWGVRLQRGIWFSPLQYVKKKLLVFITLPVQTSNLITMQTLQNLYIHGMQSIAGGQNMHIKFAKSIRPASDYFRHAVKIVK